MEKQPINQDVIKNILRHLGVIDRNNYKCSKKNIQKWNKELDRLLQMYKKLESNPTETTK